MWITHYAYVYGITELGGKFQQLELKMGVKFSPITAFEEHIDAYNE